MDSTDSLELDYQTEGSHALNKLIKTPLSTLLSAFVKNPGMWLGSLVVSVSDPMTARSGFGP